MTYVNPLIFRAYDIRGIADPRCTWTSAGIHTPADLTEDSVYLIGKATAAYLIQKYKIRNMVVGGDNRLTTQKLKEGYIKGLTETGIDVTDIGLCTSPMIYWAVCAIKFDSGTCITASHNPKEYNGLKIIAQNAHSICSDELQQIRKIAEIMQFSNQQTKHRASTSESLSASTSMNHNSKVAAASAKKLDIWPQYLKDLSSRVQLNRKLKIVIDCGNGVAGLFAPELLTKIGCEVIKLYCEPDGNFPNHEANPEELKNMRDLIAKVKEEGADLGIGFDGDGDRIGIVDELGHHYSSDYLLLLLARDLLKRIPGAKIIFDTKVSQTIIDDLKAHGAETIMSKTGHSFIEQKIKEVDAPLAGEVSGHLFFAEDYYGFDDALFAAIKILEIISRQDKPFSKLFIDLPQTYTTPEFKARCPDNKKFAIIKNLVAHFTKNYDCITIDGVRINFGDKAWGAVRASNTSPNLTLRFEAQTKERLAEIQKILADEIRKYPEVNLDWYDS